MNVSATVSERVPPLSGNLGRIAWRSLQVAIAVAVVVVPFGYAVSGAHHDVLMAAGCGLVIGVGISVRTRERIGRSAGILAGTAVGMVAALLTGLIPGNGVGWLVPPLVALAVGLIDGLGTVRLRGYRDTSIEALFMAGLIGIGLLPVFGLIWSIRYIVVVPLTALIAGAMTGRSDARHFARPPALLVLASVAAMAVALQGLASEDVARGVPLADALSSAVVSVATLLISIPAIVFLVARAAAIWLEPRLRVYEQLTEYLRVMWIPIGGFALGYMAIIIVFAGFGGMLARFSPEAFAGAEAVGWALVVFAAVMSSIQPRLERIARQTLPPASE